MEFKRDFLYEIRIRPAENGGCVVEMGCALFAFASLGDCAAALSAYGADPEEMERRRGLAFCGEDCAAPQLAQTR